MILFKKEFVPLILAGRKTQTRRLWPHGCRAKVGAVHYAKTSYAPDSTFAKIRIKRVWREEKGALWISRDDAFAEGFSGTYPALQFTLAFERINGKGALLTPLWAVEFELVK